MPLDTNDLSAIRSEVTAALRAAPAEKKFSSYRQTLQFLVADIALCTALIAALLSALSADNLDPLLGQMMGGALAWTAISLTSAIIVALIVQSAKTAREDELPPERRGALYFGMGIAAAPGLGVLYYAIRGGVGMVLQLQELPSLADALGELLA